MPIGDLILGRRTNPPEPNKNAPAPAEIPSQNSTEKPAAVVELEPAGAGAGDSAGPAGGSADEPAARPAAAAGAPGEAQGTGAAAEGLAGEPTPQLGDDVATGKPGAGGATPPPAASN